MIKLYPRIKIKNINGNTKYPQLKGVKFTIYDIQSKTTKISCKETENNS